MWHEGRLYEYQLQDKGLYNIIHFLTKKKYVETGAFFNISLFSQIT